MTAQTNGKLAALRYRQTVRRNAEEDRRNRIRLATHGAGNVFNAAVIGRPADLTIVDGRSFTGEELLAHVERLQARRTTRIETA